MIDFTFNCPDNAETGVDAGTGLPFFTAFCDDTQPNGELNGLPTAYFDCSDQPGGGGTQDKTITVVVDGEKFVYNVEGDEIWNHLVSCDTCGPGIELPAVINIDCGPGIDLPPVVTM